MQLLKQSTASTVYVGPVLDSAGAAVTTAALGDFRLIKNGTAATLTGATVTHDANGYYTVALTTTNTDTTGRLTLAVGNTAMSMSTHRYSVLLASVFDALITNATNATGGLPTATGSISALAGAISTLTAGGVRTELTTELGRLDAAITSRMASYTQPSGFLAATFQATVASQSSVDTVAGYIDTEVAAIKAKTDNLPTDPADASDIAASFGTVNSTLATIAFYIDTEVAAIKAKTDNLPTDPADASDIAASFGTVNSTLATIAGYIDTEVAAIKAKTDNLPASPAAVSDIPTTSAIATAVAATQALSRLDSMIESDGGGQFRFDTIALSNGPAGGGGGGIDWTTDERAAIRSILGVPTSGTTPTDPTVGILDTIRDKTALITPTTVVTTSPVTSTGELRGPILIGDDYLAANGRAFRWTISAITGITPGTSTARFGGKYGSTTWLVTGTVTDNGNGTWTLSCDMTRTVSGALVPGVYDWSVEIVSNSGTEITPVRSGKPVTVAIKLT